MINNGKPLLICAVPGLNLTKSHAWNIDGYKIKERTVTKKYYENNVLVNTTTETETYNMVHCDFGFSGEGNGYYVSGVFKFNDPESEKDNIYDESNKDTRNYNVLIQLITYDLP